MMFGFIPITFRFRGKTRRLLTIYDHFVDNPGVGLHPTQIAKGTGIGFSDVAQRLNDTPELFVKLPKRPDGITRYRLTSATAAQSEAEVEAKVLKLARKESLLLFAVGTMVLLVLIIVGLIITPTI